MRMSVYKPVLTPCTHTKLDLLCILGSKHAQCPVQDSVCFCCWSTLQWSNLKVAKVSRWAQGLRFDCTWFVAFLTVCYCQWKQVTTTPPMPKKRNCVCDWGKTLKTTGPVNLGNNCDSLQMLQITFSCKCGFGGETMIERFQSQAHQNVKKGTQCTQKTKLWWEPHTKITSSFTCGTITKSQNTWDSIRQTLGCFSPQELLFCSKMLVSYKTVLFALVWETNRLQRNSVSLGEKLQRIFVSVEWHCATLHVVGKMSTDRL